MVGNVIFRNVNGKQVVQSRPSNVKHSQSQKESATEFGRCSTWAKQLRLGLSDLLVGMTDTKMYQRFTAEVHNAIKQSDLPKGASTPLNVAMHSMEGFEFNTNSPFAEYCTLQFTTALTNSREVVVTIPAFEAKDGILFPDYCNHVKLITYVHATNFEVNTASLKFHSILDIHKEDSIAEQTLLTTTPIPLNYLVLIAVKLLYYKTDPITGATYLNNKNLSPAKLVWVQSIQE